MTCALCQQDLPLKKSHIIPEFIYGPLYDEKHRFHVFSTLKAKGKAKLQKGLQEYLLCSGCEVRISKYERYASLVFNGRAGVSSRRQGKLIHLSGLNYEIFKVFALSVLWRAGVSTLDFFCQVNLGSHGEALRKMVFEGDPGPGERYPFMMSLIVHEEVVQTGLIIDPIRSRVDGHYCYRFVFAGIAWVILVSSHRPPPVTRQACLTEEGKTTMLICDLETIPFITDMVKELNAMNRLPELAS